MQKKGTLVPSETPVQVHERVKKNSKILSQAKSKESNDSIMAENKRLYFKLQQVQSSFRRNPSINNTSTSPSKKSTSSVKL